MKLSPKYIFSDKDTKLIKQLEGISMNTTMYIQEVCHRHNLKVHSHAGVAHYTGGTCDFRPFHGVKPTTTNSHKNEVTSDFGVILCNDDGVLICYVGTTNDVGNTGGEHVNRPVYHFQSSSVLNDTGADSNSKSVSSVKLSYVLKRIKANWEDVLKTPLSRPITGGLIKRLLDVVCDWKKTTTVYEKLSLSTKLQHELVKCFVNKKYDSISASYNEAYKDKLKEFDTMLEKVSNEKGLNSLMTDNPMYVMGTYVHGNHEAIPNNNTMWLGEISVTSEEDRARPIIKSSDVKLYHHADYKTSPIYDKIKGKLLMYQLHLDGLDSESVNRITPYHAFHNGWSEVDNCAYSEDLGIITLRDNMSDITTIWTIVYNIDK
tara:strand:- start:327 stop:1451 length:1125 start_codon:yes stop_codon:yes gene_type:complete